MQAFRDNIPTRPYLLREWSVIIKTEPLGNWFQPSGWTGYFTTAEAESARKQADAQWMAVKLHAAERRVDLTLVEADQHRAAGHTLTAL